MRDAALPHNHGAWLVLAGGLLLGGLAGGSFSLPLFVLTLASLAGFVAVERTLAGNGPRARRSAWTAAAVAGLAGIWLLQHEQGRRLIYLAPLAVVFSLAAVRLARRHARGDRRRFELVCMSALALALPSASLVAGCPVGWPLAALSLAYLIHVAHAVLRTHAHLDPKLRGRAQLAGLFGAGLVFALAISGGLPVILAIAVLIGLIEPWLPRWQRMPAKRIGRRESLLLAALPLAWLAL